MRSRSRFCRSIRSRCFSRRDRVAPRLFDRPERHRRLIVALMVSGPHPGPPGSGSQRRSAAASPVTSALSIILKQLKYGFGHIRAMWLTFAYMGTVLLLVAHNRAWLRRLGPFGWRGRMALTIYMLQIAILDLTFSKYTFHVQLTPLRGLAAGILLFVVNAALARWWLGRFRFGRFEWLWRSITYGHLQQWRLESVGA